MKIIAIIGQKGGGGKTTIAENLAVEAGADGHQVVLIDLDPQATASKWGDRREADEPVVQSAQHARLPQVLAAARGAGMSLAIIDTAGRSSEATIAAAEVAQLCLIPVRPLVKDVETLQGVGTLLKATTKHPRSAVVINAAPAIGNRHSEAAEAAETYGFSVAPAVLCERRAFGDAPLTGQGVREYDPSGKAAAESAALYRYVSLELGMKRGEG